MGNDTIVKYIDFNFNTLVNNSINQLKLKIYPNPFENYLNLEIYLMEKSQSNIEIFDYTGKSVYRKEDVELISGNNNLLLDNLNFKTGIYCVKIITNNTMHNEKIFCKY